MLLIVIYVVNMYRISLAPFSIVTLTLSFSYLNCISSIYFHIFPTRFDVVLREMESVSEGEQKKKKMANVITPRTDDLYRVSDVEILLLLLYIFSCDARFFSGRHSKFPRLPPSLSLSLRFFLSFSFFFLPRFPPRRFASGSCKHWTAVVMATPPPTTATWRAHTEGGRRGGDTVFTATETNKEGNNSGYLKNNGRHIYVLLKLTNNSSLYRGPIFVLKKNPLPAADDNGSYQSIVNMFHNYFFVRSVLLCRGIFLIV